MMIIRMNSLYLFNKTDVLKLITIAVRYYNSILIETG